MHAAKTRPLKVLETLVARGHDVAHLHQAALDRLSAEHCRRSVRAIQRLHTWRNLQLASAALLVGGVPHLPAKPTLRAWFHSRVLRGSDQRIMQTLESQHSELIAVFDAALGDELPEEIKRLVGHHREEIVRHRAWLSHRIAELSGRAVRQPKPPKRRGHTVDERSTPAVGESAA